jgi:hypothetical protein
MTRRAKVQVTRRMVAVVEIDLPDHITDELGWYDELTDRAAAASNNATWDTLDDSMVALPGGDGGDVDFIFPPA